MIKKAAPKPIKHNTAERFLIPSPYSPVQVNWFFISSPGRVTAIW
jgi:hypothetical protein